MIKNSKYDLINWLVLLIVCILIIHFSHLLYLKFIDFQESIDNKYNNEVSLIIEQGTNIYFFNYECFDI